MRLTNKLGTILCVFIFTAVAGIAKTPSIPSNGNECLGTVRPKISFDLVAKHEQIEYFEKILLNAPSSSCEDATIAREDRPPEFIFRSDYRLIVDGKIDVPRTGVGPGSFRDYIEKFDAKSDICGGTYFLQSNNVRSVMFFNTIQENRPDWTIRCFYSALFAHYSVTVPNRHDLSIMELETMMIEKFETLVSGVE